MTTGQIPSSILNDPDQSSTESALIHQYPGSMPAYLASRLSDRYSTVGDTVFDPFCGSGSVLVEAAKLGRTVVGVDLLDVSILIARMPFELPSLSEIVETWIEIKTYVLKKHSLFSEAEHTRVDHSGAHKLLSDWLHKDTFSQVMAAYGEIRKLSDDNKRNFFGLLLSGTLISLSKRKTRGVLHWGWIADNVKPLENELLQTDALAEVDWRITRLIDFMKATNGYKLLESTKWAIYKHNWLSELDFSGLTDESVDLLLTSPPYPYSIDYTLALRLTHYLLEIPFGEMRNEEIGARFKRKRRSREAQYLEELRKSLNRAAKKVKVSGKAVFVLPHPNEYTKVVNMTTDEWLGFIGESMEGKWAILEVGFRDCAQRRVVHKTKTIRRELVAAFNKVSE